MNAIFHHCESPNGILWLTDKYDFKESAGIVCLQVGAELVTECHLVFSRYLKKRFVQ